MPRELQVEQKVICKQQLVALYRSLLARVGGESGAHFPAHHQCILTHTGGMEEGCGSAAGRPDVAF